MKRPLLTLFVVLAMPMVAFACIWDSDTLEDELKQNATTFNVITGQFARHGEAYYRARLERSKQELVLTPDSIETLYDIGAAHLRLGEYEHALDAFQRVEQISPDRYKTHSNLGVLYGEMGKPELAIRHMKKALGKHPSAHFGAGWLHLRMIEWESILFETGEPGICFLGTPYGERWKMGIRRQASERAKAMGLELDEDYDGIKVLTTLLRANPDFADGYFVLAANLHGNWNLNMALWAYMKAKALGHPRTDIIDSAIDEIFKHWKETLDHRQGRHGQHLEPKAEALKKIEQALESAKPWIDSFRAHEAKWIETTGNLPSFEEVRTSLEQAGIKRCEPIQVGLIGATGADGGSPANDGESQHGNGPSTGGSRARGAPKSKGKVQEQKQARSPAELGGAPRQGGPPPPAPPVMNADGEALRNRAPDLHGAHEEADDAGTWDTEEVDAQSGPALPEGLEVVGPWSAPETLGPRTSEGSGMPWYVWFGFGTLAVSLVVVVIARARTT